MDALGGNFGAKIGLFDPDDVVADTAAFSATDKNMLQELKLKSLTMVVLVT